MPHHRLESLGGRRRPWLVVTADTPFGLIRGVVSGDRLGYSSLKAGTMEEFLDWVRGRLGDDAEFGMAPEDAPASLRFRNDVHNLLHNMPAGYKPDLSINTPFQKQVASQVEQIPFGETASYGDIAAAPGSPAAPKPWARPCPGCLSPCSSPPTGWCGRRAFPSAALCSLTI